jgi:spermidine/putrescine transport system substrate-binding protein
MSEEITPDEMSRIDPAFLRGLTQRRLTRRDVLRVAGLSAGGVGAAALLAACGGGASTVDLPNAHIGTASWWAKQKLNRTVNFANWPYYIDITGGKHLSLEHFTATTGIAVNYSEPIQDDPSFYQKIRPSLAAKQQTGYDLMVITNNSPVLGYLIEFGWLTPLDHTLMPNFFKNAGPLVKNPPWDPHNKFTAVWQAGWTGVGYNSSLVKNPGDSLGILFDKKYAGQVGMFSDPQELGSIALLALGIEPASSTESDWHKAVKLLKKQKSDGIVAAYYDQSYIDHLKNGDIMISQAYSGDIFQANLNSKYKDLTFLIPKEGSMLWDDNMCIPLYAQNPKDAMHLLDYFYDPQTQAVVEYYDDYVCPVPAAQNELLHPTGWAAQTLRKMEPEIGLAPSLTANATSVFPTPERRKLSRSYYQYKSQEEIDTWNNLFLPIVQGS